MKIVAMKKSCPSRAEDRWEHALLRPLTSRTKFELIELMRVDLFEYLDVLTTDPHTDKRSRASVDLEIQRTSERLKDLTAGRTKALGKAFKARRVEYIWQSDLSAALRGEPETGISCAPAQTYWESVQ
jgi:hypothetical protein